MRVRVRGPRVRGKHLRAQLVQRRVFLVLVERLVPEAQRPAVVLRLGRGLALLLDMEVDASWRWMHHGGGCIAVRVSGGRRGKGERAGSCGASIKSHLEPRDELGVGRAGSALLPLMWGFVLRAGVEAGYGAWLDLSSLASELERHDDAGSAVRAWQSSDGCSTNRGRSVQGRRTACLQCGGGVVARPIFERGAGFGDSE